MMQIEIILPMKTLLILLCAMIMLLAGSEARGQGNDSSSSKPIEQKIVVKNIDANEAE